MASAIAPCTSMVVSTIILSPLSHRSPFSPLPLSFTPFRHQSHSSLRRRASDTCHISVRPRRFAASASASSSGGSGNEEERWLREESRWLREEQRWLREEQRWEREKAQLVTQLEHLKQALAASLQGVPSAAIDVEVHLRSLGVHQSTASSAALPPPPTNSSATSSPSPVLSQLVAQEEPLTPPPALKTPAAPKFSTPAPASSSSSSAYRTLRVGMEGDDVEKMQNALGIEGFYCGEDDTENSYFSSATESAVKTWQATMKVPEDGLMTPALLALLYGEDDPGADAGPTPPELAPVTRPSVTRSTQSAEPTRDRPEIERFARSSLEMGEHRVFLLGEQRWEDPQRSKKAMDDRTAALAANDSMSFGSTRAVNGVINSEVGNGARSKGMILVKQCFQCRGDGRVTCLECEGTGDMNIEEQFLDWVGGDARCLYCDGTGAATCDVCDGSGQH